MEKKKYCVCLLRIMRISQWCSFSNKEIETDRKKKWFCLCGRKAIMEKKCLRELCYVWIVSLQQQRDRYGQRKKKCLYLGGFKSKIDRQKVNQEDGKEELKQEWRRNGWGNYYMCVWIMRLQLQRKRYTEEWVRRLIPTSHPTTSDNPPYLPSHLSSFAGRSINRHLGKSGGGKQWCPGLYSDPVCRDINVRT